MKVSIDVVIPSFRLEEKYIVPILRLRKPIDADIKFYLIADNPHIVPSPAILEFTDQGEVSILINEQNMGAAQTRNRGIEAGIGEWILFLDDDIIVQENLLEVYAEAAQAYPGEIGFIGMIALPEPESNFTKAVKASGSMDIFSIALRRESFAWGATANIMVRRNAVGNTRFSALYPKSGGGEDVDFFLKVRESHAFKNYTSLPRASVIHPWWNNKRINFKRPFRYGVGNSWLGDLNPLYTYRDFLNTPETIFVTLLATIVLLCTKPGWVPAVLLFLAGVVCIEIIASAVQTIKRFKKVSIGIIVYVMLLRISHETGVLAGKLSRFKWAGIGERFHDDGAINKIYFYRSNTYRTIKWILYPLLIIVIFYFRK